MQITFAQLRPLQLGQSLYVTGNCNELGNWNPENAIKLNYQMTDLWIGQIDLNLEFVVEYKYFVAQTDNPKQDIKWDDGNNRVLDKMMVTEQLKVMTFNIRYDCKEDGKNDWNHRKSVVYKLIRKINPEIFGLQEVLAHQQADLQSNLQGNYNFIGRGRQNNFWDDEGCPIYYDMLKYNIVQAEVFWFSDTPYVAGSKSYGNGFPRICTYVKLLHKMSQKVFHVYNTHFDHENKLSQIKSAEQIKRHIQQYCSPEDKIIVMGDLNSLPMSDAVKILTSPIWQGFTLQNTMGVLDMPLATMHAWYGLKLGLHIDYIFLGNLKYKSMMIVNDLIDGQYPSDHFPKVVVYE
ncbi:unnamed protein product (macronuclear) [Paramecium tetraurelia]|uniref:CBM20 domain-containing protein n=1 Tax=Paramecium tetraurelia TaxID=5888 RepID=A0D0P2_PARTE|nr:uncharacterized protein GSPATT00012161001 [Paramecium tetraurelia]CAK76609.1 unnamed protein product [Paramecium tetraurelia]|eukprot:XP_001444006.1 hypothetical protein (macronuclear) [Paramecium tetraurelia strain d4-2]